MKGFVHLGALPDVEVNGLVCLGVAEKSRGFGCPPAPVPEGTDDAGVAGEADPPDGRTVCVTHDIAIPVHKPAVIELFEFSAGKPVRNDSDPCLPRHDSPFLQVRHHPAAADSHRDELQQPAFGERLVWLGHPFQHPDRTRISGKRLEPFGDIHVLGKDHQGHEMPSRVDASVGHKEPSVVRRFRGSLGESVLAAFIPSTFGWLPPWDAMGGEDCPDLLPRHSEPHSDLRKRHPFFVQSDGDIVVWLAPALL